MGNTLSALPSQVLAKVALIVFFCFHTFTKIGFVEREVFQKLLLDGLRHRVNVSEYPAFKLKLPLNLSIVLDLAFVLALAISGRLVKEVSQMLLAHLGC